MIRKISFLMFLILNIGLVSISAQTEIPAVKKISGGVLNGKATSLPIPAFPAAAKAVRAGGAVNVQVTIDEQGNVVSASAVSGHPLLRQAAEQAALSAKFAPTTLSGQPVSVTGILVYNFVGDANNTAATPSVNLKWMTIGLMFGFSENNSTPEKISLPTEFSSEQEQLNALANLSPDQRKIQISTIVSSIKSKLTGADLWRFEFGLAKGGIISNMKDDSAIMLHLAKFGELAANQSAGVTEEEMNRAAELSKLAAKGTLTAEDKRALYSYLR